uniref:At2g44820/T13E15.17 n=1 Tax=Arabidopsis thaliana TaxID=3702 RepID=Q8RY35_ARATH|nr:At2g44820/T13E15.17 [Arabidopsis thaliana]
MVYKRKSMEKKKEGMGSTIDQNLSFKNIMKDVALFGSSHTTWKDKKALEDKKVTALGGKAQKMHRLPLSVARVQMKKQKDREEKMLEQNVILGRFGGGGSSSRKPAERKRTPEERVLKSTGGIFKGGVLDVKHLLRSGPSSSSDRDFKTKKPSRVEKNLGGGGDGGGIKSKGKKKGGKNKNKGRKKGGGKKRGK